MAYISNNLVLVFSPISATLPRFFMYYNADADSDATIVGAGFFSDGVDKGLRKGDIVDAVNVGTPKYKRYQGLSVSGSATTVQAPTAIT